ncbi:TVP38/TMEM64 family protein [bacterium]|nr:TVP38/TMEM64 family protein [bacterium]
MSKTKIFVFTVGAIMLAATVGVIASAPQLLATGGELVEILSQHDHEALTTYIHSFGWPGALILFLLQAFQVFVPIFPVVLLQVAAGAAYGVFWGSLILMTSYTMSNFVIFLGLRHLGWQLPAFLERTRAIKKCRRLISEHSPETVVFVLYLFPFLSNCFVPFMAVQTKIPFRRYAWIMMLSCLPMMLTSIYLGDRLLAHDWLMAGVAFVAGSAISIGLYGGQNQILSWYRNKSEHKNNDNK